MWRHLVNCFGLDNATLKLQHHGGVSRTGKTSVVFVEPGAKVNSQYCDEKVFGQGLLHLCKMWPLQVDAALQQHGAPSHTVRSTV